MSARERKKPYARESAWGLCWYPASAICAALTMCSIVRRSGRVLGVCVGTQPARFAPPLPYVVRTYSHMDFLLVLPV